MPASTTARLHDGSQIELEVQGDGPVLLLPVDPQPVEGEKAEQLRAYGADPALGQSLIGGLRDVARVVAFDYQGLVLRDPKPDTLTPENVAADLLAVADAAGADKFAYYGYSWLAMVGLQLALRTDRLAGLAMGGYPAIDGPYEEMLRVTTAGHELASGVRQIDPEEQWTAAGLSEPGTRQFVTLYRALQGFDDRAALPRITGPRLCFVGSADEITYGKSWGDLRVSMAEPVVRGRAELEALGWEVRVLEGLDHMQAMQAVVVVPLLREWLAAI